MVLASIGFVIYDIMSTFAVPTDPIILAEREALKNG
jgi:hypothetical protein